MVLLRNDRIEVICAHGQVIGGTIPRFINRACLTTFPHQFSILPVRITLVPLIQIVTIFRAGPKSKKRFRSISVFYRLVFVPIIDVWRTEPQRIEGQIVNEFDYGITGDFAFKAACNYFAACRNFFCVCQKWSDGRFADLVVISDYGGDCVPGWIFVFEENQKK